MVQIEEGVNEGSDTEAENGRVIQRIRRKEGTCRPIHRL